MRTFVTIVDRGSLTAAANSLDRSQPTIVRTLAALETRLGARLLQRTTRRMSLTPEGRDYLHRCRRILADIEEAEQAVGETIGEPRGDLRITAPVQFGQLHIAPALSAFMRHHKQVRIDLQLVDHVVDLVDEGIDLAVRIGHLTNSSLIATRIGAVRQVVCASPALLRTTGIPEHPNALAGLPCIRFQNLHHTDSWRFLDGDREFIVNVDGNFSCNQVAAATAACVDGLGFAQLLSYQVQHQVGSKQLELVLEKFESRPLPVNLVYPGRRLVSARLRALLNWLRDALHQSNAFE